MPSRVTSGQTWPDLSDQPLLWITCGQILSKQRRNGPNRAIDRADPRPVPDPDVQFSQEFVQDFWQELEQLATASVAPDGAAPAPVTSRADEQEDPHGRELHRRRLLREVQREA